ncbi:MAG: hypothetical protein ACRETZ_18240, partial [Steroidobacteraceae bacterium]
MADPVRGRCAVRGIHLVAAACALALAGCATTPGQAGSPAAQPPDPPPAGAKAAHPRHETNPYFRTVTSTSEGTVTVEGQT